MTNAAIAHEELGAWRSKGGPAPLDAVCPVRGVLDKLGDKWSMLVILELSAGESIGTLHRNQALVAVGKVAL